MKRAIFLLITSILLTCNASPLVQPETFEASSEFEKASDPNHRLRPQNIDISRYDVWLAPYFSGPNAFTFDGEVTITAKTTAVGVNNITLHARFLTFEKVSVTRADGSSYEPAINPIDEVYHFWTIDFQDPLDNGEEIQISVIYKGILQTDMSGFYRSYYEEKKTNKDGTRETLTKWMGTTQFQPVHARKAFPCFDEPGYKAVFQITIKRPSSFSPSLSNTKLQSSTTDGDSTVDKFYETPKMSAYLIAFVVSEYVAANKTSESEADQFGIWTRPEASNQGEYAFVTSQKIVNTMGEYLNYPFRDMDENLKNDHVSIPDFSAGAMENWGLVTYRENNLMYDPNDTSVKTQQNIASIIAHEVTHFWFGDLVTCKWWSETWLNEGFARYFQYYLTDMMEDEDKVMDMGVQFSTAQTHTVMVTDALNTSTPMSNVDTNSPAEVQGQFGTVTYNKGASVIRMVRDWIGESTFRKALSKYMVDMQFQATVEQYLFDHLQEAADEDSSIAQYENTNVKDLMSSWTNFEGYPYLHVNVIRNGANSRVMIEQNRFLKANMIYEDADRLWHIPITYTTQSENNFDSSRKAKFVLTQRSAELSEHINADEWIIFNIQQTGYLRVQYDFATLRLITDALRKENTIHPSNKAQLVDDLFNFAREGMMSYSQLLFSTLFLNTTTEYAPWTAAIAGFSFMRERFYYTSALNKLDFHIDTMIKDLTTDLQFEEAPTDNHLRKLFRINVFNFICPFREEVCSSANQMFEDFLDGGFIKPNNREYVYCTILNGNGPLETEAFDVLWNKYLVENVNSEKIVLLNSLGCNPIKEKIMKFLFSTLLTESPIRDQDLMAAYNSVLNGNRLNVPAAFEFISENVRSIKQRFGEANYRTMINSLANKMDSADLDKLEAFLDENVFLTAEDVSAGKRSVQTARENLQWAEEHAEEIIAFVDSLYGN